MLLLSDSCLAGTAPESAIDDSDMPDILPPDNALHLHVPSDHVKDIVVPLPDGKEFERRGSITLATSDSVSCSRPGTFRVRFRSRVRIASARRTSHTASIDSSPSSSISAPLRYTPDDVDYDNLQHYATYAYPHRPQFQRPSRASLRSNPPSVGPPSVNDISASEQTPLLRAPGSRLGVRTRKRYGLADEDDEDEETSTERQAARKAQEEKAFGKWPYRLLNGYVSAFLVSEELYGYADCRCLLFSLVPSPVDARRTAFQFVSV